jgi:hypothetical protein
MAPEAMGEFVLLILETLELHQPHVVAPNVGTPAVLFASANHLGTFKSMVIGSGATDHTDLGGILDELVNAASLEPYKKLTGEEFVRGATDNMKKYKLPGYALEDYLASYAGARFFESVEFIRDYPQSLPALPGGSPKSRCLARSLWAGMIRLFQSPTPRVCTKGAEEQTRRPGLWPLRLGRRRCRVWQAGVRMDKRRHRRTLWSWLRLSRPIMAASHNDRA